MDAVEIEEAITQLERLVTRFEHGEEIVIASAGKPVAKLVAYRSQKKKLRRGGQWEGKLRMSDDFDDPLPPEILQRFVDPKIDPDS